MRPIGEVRYLFVHTAAYSGSAGVDEIRQWHLDRGWEDIGYHYVVRKSGNVEQGRSVRFAGAHVQGVNSKSIGICCEGHGDHLPLTLKQGEALVGLLRGLMRHYNVPASRVLGHKEVNKLVDANVVGDGYRTTKTCPGRNIDMGMVRQLLELRGIYPEPKIEMVDSGIHTDLPPAA